MASTPYEVVLFDLGGVLADLGDPSDAMGLGISTDQFWEIWLASPLVRAFETGSVSETDFIPGIAKELLVTEPDRFESQFLQWKLSLFDGAEQQLAELSQATSLALLSNTNPIHWQQVTNSTNVFRYFSHVFLSFETGLYKPDVESFTSVLAQIDTTPGRIIYLDDSEQNVNAARGIGIDGRLVSDFRSAMTELS